LFRQQKTLFKILLPIVNADVVLSIISLKGDENIRSSLEDMTYIAQIYGNFLFLINEAERDTLTSLYNRRTFDAKLARMLSVQKSIKHTEIKNRTTDEQRDLKLEECAWLVTIDIDYFKRVNDQFGHIAGDEVLLQLSQKMKDFFRSTDLLF
jgi:GGDEF domain-containing protein